MCPTISPGTQVAKSATLPIVTRAIPLIVAATLLCACTPQASDGPLEGKLSNNGLALRLDAIAKLSTAPLSVTTGTTIALDEETFGPLLASEGGPELLQYIATCALNEGQELSIASTGALYPGNLGLATNWARSTCDLDCQGWVTACILAHANLFEETVEIAPRGNHPNLPWDDAMTDLFRYEEAAYYGNMFKPTGQAVMAACAGAMPEEDEIAITGRVCDVGACDFDFRGECYDLLELEPDAANIQLGACDLKLDGSYGACGGSVDPDSELVVRFDQVLTVYLEPTE